MIKFLYSDKFNEKEYELLRTEAEIKVGIYIKKFFEKYMDIDIIVKFADDEEFEKLKKSGISCYAYCNSKEKKITINFNEMIAYISLSGDKNWRVLIPEINEKYAMLFNAIHHEVQHIINRIEHEKTFEYINSINTFNYTKLMISKCIDEYIAWYSAQKENYIETNYLYERLDELCNKRQDVIMKNNQFEKFKLVENIIYALAAGAAEEKVQEENNFEYKSKDYLDTKSIRLFYINFINIKNALRAYNKENYKKCVDNCEVEISSIIKVLGLNEEYLKI